ncbi:MAG: T9SS type A sorting domain-containing protein [Bacteroidetes bacterium]|nr:T9SS type A sorting domain-containing protein [Bacteroidota bacterium]
MVQKSILFILLFFTFTSYSQNIYRAPKTLSPVLIDGIGNDSIWAKSNWHNVDQLWLGKQPVADDFIERFKVCWDNDRLYVLAEVTDDSLSDHYSNPLTSYWEDDTWEVFIDEDKSGGDHQKNYNAFAYHFSKSLDAVDIGIDGLPHLYNSNVNVQRTASGKTYTWEASFDVYTDAFVYGALSNPKASLVKGKILGFAMAYCDNDGGASRQSFMGSETIAAVDKNVAYKNASVFGALELVDTVFSNGIQLNDVRSPLEVFPNPASGTLNIRWSGEGEGKIEIMDFNSSLQISQTINSGNTFQFNTASLCGGIYLLRYSSGAESCYKKIVIE